MYKLCLEHSGFIYHMLVGFCGISGDLDSPSPSSLGGDIQGTVDGY